MVPLWWDAGTLEDLRAWKRDCGGEDSDQFIAPLHDDKPFSRHTLRKRYRTACRVLGSVCVMTTGKAPGRYDVEYGSKVYTDCVIQGLEWAVETGLRAQKNA